jgi:hypothetical protein
MKKLFAVLTAAFIGLVSLAGCSDAQIASHNLTSAADNFDLVRRIVFYNGITGEYMLVIEGRCSIGKPETFAGVAITCKTGNANYKKHFLGLSDNVTFFAEQIDGANVSVDHYRVVFKPSAIVPDVMLK